jgi:hypothetical protein
LSPYGHAVKFPSYNHILSACRYGCGVWLLDWHHWVFCFLGSSFCWAASVFVWLDFRGRQAIDIGVARGDADHQGFAAPSIAAGACIGMACVAIASSAEDV